MEAMSFGIPVIATDVGGTREIVNNKNGILLGANPLPLEVARNMDDFISLNQNERITKRRAAFETWKENYSAKSKFLLQPMTFSHKSFLLVINVNEIRYSMLCMSQVDKDVFV